MYGGGTWCAQQGYYAKIAGSLPLHLYRIRDIERFVFLLCFKADDSCGTRKNHTDRKITLFSTRFFDLIHIYLVASEKVVFGAIYLVEYAFRTAHTNLQQQQKHEKSLGPTYSIDPSKKIGRARIERGVFDINNAPHHTNRVYGATLIGCNATLPTDTSEDDASGNSSRLALRVDRSNPAHQADNRKKTWQSCDLTRAT